MHFHEIGIGNVGRWRPLIDNIDTLNVHQTFLKDERSYRPLETDKTAIICAKV